MKTSPPSLRASLYLLAWLIVNAVCWAPLGSTQEGGSARPITQPSPAPTPREHDQSFPIRPGVKRYDQPDQAQAYFLLKRLPEGETELPIEKYFQARDEMSRMPQYSTALNQALPSLLQMRATGGDLKLGAWTALGPGNIGGRTRALLIHPQNPQLMYAAGVAGGVWKSTSAGQSWQPLSDLIANIAVNSMAFDPQDPDIIYAGTGEGYFAIDNVRGAGIFRSTDAGTTWTRLAGTLGSDFHYVNDIVVSRHDGKRLYAATRTGVWRSADGGVTWRQVLSTSVQGGCYDFATRDDQAKDYLFVACGNFQQATVYRQKDGASDTTWETVLNDSGMGRTVLAVAPSNQNIVYALSAAFSGTYNHGLHAVFRSEASGDAGTWAARVRNTDPNKLNTIILSNPASASAVECKFGTSNSYSGQSWYDLTIAVDPLDANRVWAGAIDLFRSDDGGATWGLAGFVYPNEGTWKIHPDQHIIVFHPQYNGTTNQQMYVGNDGGLYRTDNARAKVAIGAPEVCSPASAQVGWINLNNEYAVTQFYHGVVAPDGSFYFGGTQDNGTVRGDLALSPNQWREINGADGGYGAVDFRQPTILYASTQNTGIRKSTDQGGTFSSATLGLTENGLFITPIAMDPSDPRRLYTGGANLFRTTNGASLWTSGGSFRGLSFSGSASISAIAVSPLNSSRGVVGMSDGSIVRTDRLLTLSSTSPPSSQIEKVTRPRTGYVSWVAFDPANQDIAYATYSTFGGVHVWRTMDGGVSWSPLDGTGAGVLPDVPVHCLVVDPTATSRLYIGTDVGVFVSTDGGISWSVENTGFANVITETLIANVHNGVTTLYAFTHGRGAYRVTANLDGCSPYLSETTKTFGPGGGEVTIDVALTPAGCSWQAQSNAGWIKLLSQGAGKLSLKIEANPDPVQRVGTVTLAGRSFTAYQNGTPDLEPPTIAVTSPSGNPINTTSGSIAFSGTAKDNVRVQSVSYRTSNGLAVTLSGTTAWSTGSIPLSPGRNVIALTALDDAGNSSWPVSLIVNAVLPSVLTTVAGTGVQGYSGDGGPAVIAQTSRPVRLAFDQAGNFYFTDYNNHSIRRVTPDGSISTVAGNGRAGFSGDNGPAVLAQLNLPAGVAVDLAGNLYIADTGNHRIRRVDAQTKLITTVAGTGQAGFGGDNGPATGAILQQPENVTLDDQGNLYIADFQNHRIRKVALSTGIITTFAGTGSAGFTGDGGQARNAALRSPNDVQVDRAGGLWISDSGNYRVRFVDLGAGIIETVAGNGNASHQGDGGPALAASFASIISLAVDGQKNLYLVDRTSSRVRKVSANDKTITTIAGGSSGFSPDGSGAMGARLSAVTGVAVDPSGAVFITDRDNFRIRKIVTAVNGDASPPSVTIADPTSSGTWATSQGVITLRGAATDNSAVVAVRWENDRGGSGAAFGTSSWAIPQVSLLPGPNLVRVTAWDANGNSWTATLAINCQLPRLLQTIAGTGASGSAGDGGPGVAATLNLPSGVAVDNSGNIYLTDSSNRRVRKLAPNGIISAFAGTGDLGSSGDDGPAIEATFNYPRGIAVDRAGNVYIGDSNSHRIRRVSPDGIIRTVAGTGKGFGDFGGDGGPATAADLSGPQGIALDAAGNLYIADRSNSRIRKVNAATGIIETIAGIGTVSFSGDGGPAKQAELFLPTGVAVDGAGNLYLADQGNQRIRRIDAATDIITTVAGTGVSGYNGDDIPAVNAQLSLSFPTHLSVDAAGNVIFPDRGNHRVRKIDVTTGKITTIAGTGTAGSWGDNGDPLAIPLQFPTAAIVDSTGRLIVADNNNHRIRRIVDSTQIAQVAPVSAASYLSAQGLAPESIVAVFGLNLTLNSESAASIPLPTSLGTTAVKIRDSLGIERLAPLFYVSSPQINLQVPNGTALGPAEMSVTTADGQTATATFNVTNVNPGLFAANGTGSGIAAALVLRIRANGEIRYEPVYQLNPFTPLPIDLGPESDQVFLVLFGTGFRFNSGLAAVNATIGGIEAPVTFAGAAPDYIGLDQANLLLPRSLAGKGAVNVSLTVEGKTTNLVTVELK